MTENRKFIRFFAWITAFFLMLTYLFSLIDFSWRFLNSDFLEIIFGGLFASFGVMLLAEIKKYSINKRLAEDTLYETLLSMYSELMVEIINTNVYLDNLDKEVPDNLYNNRAPAMNSYLLSLRRIDYSPVKESKLSQSWEKYKQNELRKLDKHIGYCNTHLSMAINREKIKALERKLTSYNPIGKDHDVEITLIKMKVDAIKRTHAINQLLDTLSSACMNRYNWKDEKEKYQTIKVGLPSENPELKAFFEE